MKGYSKGGGSTGHFSGNKAPRSSRPGNKVGRSSHSGGMKSGEPHTKNPSGSSGRATVKKAGYA